MNKKKTDLDPFRAIVGMLETKKNSNLLRAVANSSGLEFDTHLSGNDNYSEKYRISALVPRILRAYEAHDDLNRLAVARAAFASLGPLQVEAESVLGRIGWAVRNGELVISAPDVREMFFPKGTPWDAYVVLQGILAEATQEITVVDAYADSTVFQMLARRTLDGLRLHILCSKYARAVAGEAKHFRAQYSGITIEIRQSRDFHDRFIVLDEKTCIHLGASIKDAGKAAFLISRLEDEGTRSALLGAINEAWKGADPIT